MLKSRDPRKNLQKILFQALLFLLPTQVAYHFWPSWALVEGIRVDYLSPAVYLTDIVLFALFFLWTLEWLLDKKRKRPKFSKRYLLFLAVFIFSLFNAYYAQRPQAALVKWVKVYELAFLTIYIIDKKRMITEKLVFTPLSLALIYSSVIAVVQFLLQRTIGGPLYLLGERNFTASTPGIAKALYLGRELMRPYSIFPHPNVLAGFTSVSGFFLLRAKGPVFLKVVVGLFSLSVLVLATSLGAWTALFVVAVFMAAHRLAPKIFKRAAVSLFFLVVFLGILFPIVIVQFNKINFGESTLRRVELNEAAGKMFSRAPLTGIGLNNFIVELPKASLDAGVTWFLQPIHNIFLLIFVETGILGFLMFVCLFFIGLKKSFQIVGSKALYVFVLLLIIITGSFDHYWVTLQQTQLLLAVFAGFVYR